MEDKPRVTLVTDPDLIEAIQRNGLHDPIGGKFNDAWYAYTFSIEHYRRTQQTKRPTDSNHTGDKR